ncbi:hypothetical protein ACFOZ5_07470 [Marinobacter lacisalsi]|uniref:Uncharacterized protein n=1 Tax=Marinobacter lacisalsi TaxID=475979 RepID=A0ABV8QHH8_9GAMM
MLRANQGATPFSLPTSDKALIDQFLQQAQQSSDSEDFAKRFTDQRHPAWQRYLNGIYNHPKTWWIGIIQVQMVTGLWGERQKARAMLRQQALGVLIYKLTDPKHEEEASRIRSRVVRFSLKYRKADLTGRMHGGLFTNYASTGGRIGAGRLNRKVKVPVAITNFVIASFGGAIKAIAENHDSADQILLSILTGEAGPLPDGYYSLAENSPEDALAQEIMMAMDEALNGVDALNQISPAPVPISEFCAQADNANKYKDLCK